MQVRKYHAPSMHEALQLVRRELGPHAIIVSTKTVDRGRGTRNSGSVHQGVEVVAAIDHDLTAPAGEAKALPHPMGAKGSLWREFLSERVSLDHMRQELGELRQTVKRTLSSPFGERGDSMGSELRELKWIIQRLSRQVGTVSHYNFPEPLVPWYWKMLTQGISEDTVVQLLGEVGHDLSPSALGDGAKVRALLGSKIARVLTLSGPITLVPGKTKVAALVGPTGVGKTTTLAKLAARYALEEKGKVALLTIDTYRIAAVEQLKIYATIMGLPFKAVSSPEEFTRAVGQCAGCDLILVDTAGRSHWDRGHSAELKRFLSQSFPIEIYLLMSITHREDTLSATSDQFGLLGLDRVIFTKLDESDTYGSMLNQLKRMHKPLSYVTTGQKVPEDIEIATQERFISLVLGEAAFHYC